MLNTVFFVRQVLLAAQIKMALVKHGYTKIENLKVGTTIGSTDIHKLQWGYSNGKYFTILSYGSAKCKYPNESQVNISFDKEGAEKLKKLLDEFIKE